MYAVEVERGLKLIVACLGMGAGLGCGGSAVPGVGADARVTETTTTETMTTTASSIEADADTSSTNLPACSWPASLDKPDAVTTGCYPEGLLLNVGRLLRLPW